MLNSGKSLFDTNRTETISAPAFLQTGIIIERNKLQVECKIVVSTPANIRKTDGMSDTH